MTPRQVMAMPSMDATDARARVTAVAQVWHVT